MITKVIAINDYKEIYSYIHNKLVMAIFLKKGTEEDRKIWHEMAVEIEKDDLFL